MRRFFTLIGLFFFIAIHPFAQSVKVDCKDMPLDELLRSFKVEISFDPVSISHHRVTLTKEFEDAKSAIDFLIVDKGLVCELMGSVYVISPKPQPDIPLVEAVVPMVDFTGVVMDGKSGERLPYSLVASNGSGVYSDVNGVFTLKVFSNTNLHFQIHYLGYEVLDTILSYQPHVNFSLLPLAVELKEIQVASHTTAMRMQQGESVGQLRVNHAVSKYMASVGDNSVYTLLKLMPGVRASGEPSGDLFVWGSGTGESRVVYDGITIFGLRNFNDNIGFVNPFMVKDIRLQKGGYDASVGGQVGGVAEIIGISGNTDKPTLKANVNNLTANILGSVPLGSRSSFTMAYRQTFYSLYDPEKLNPYKKVDTTQVNTPSRASLTVVPDYTFRDINGKLAGKMGVNDNYSLNFYGSEDRFDYTLTNYKRINLEESSTNRQFGVSGAYNKVWEKGGVSTARLNYSQLNSSEDKLSGLLVLGNSYISVANSSNRVEEFGFLLTHEVDWNEHNKLLVGGQWLGYQTQFNGTSSYLYAPNLNISNGFSRDKFTLNYGARIDIPIGLLPVFQPRLTAGYQISEVVKVTLGAGRYYQPLQHAPRVDADGAYQLAWSVADNDSTPSLDSKQLVGGISFQSAGFLLSVEGFVKETRGVVALSKISQQVISYSTTSKAVGSDLFLKYNFSRFSLFGSASICEQTIATEQMQQEYKGGFLVNLHPFYLSMNYVWGTGFNYLGTASYSDRPFYTEQYDEVYKRLDGALSYRLKAKAFDMQLGLVVINIFDDKNLKYRYQVPPSKIISGSISNLYLEAESFTPTLFLEIGF